MHWLRSTLFIAAFFAGSATALEADDNTLVRQILGEIHSVRQQELHVEVTGKSSSSRLALGSVVHKGQLILQLDDREARGRFREAAAVLKNWKSKLAVAVLQLERAEKNYQRGVIPLADIEQIRANKIQLHSEVERAEATLDILELAVQKHRLLAPFDGVLSQATPHNGERLQPGNAVAVLIDQTQLTVRASLSPDEVLALTAGNLELRELTALTEPLAIREISPAANPKTGMVGLEMYCCSGNVIPGQTLTLGLFRTPPRTAAVP